MFSKHDIEVRFQNAKMAIEISSTEKGLIDFFSDFIDIFKPFPSFIFISRTHKYYVLSS